MGRELYDNFAAARAVFDEADEALGFALSQLIFEGPEETLRLTEHTQPAILTVSIAAARVLVEALSSGDCGRRGGGALAGRVLGACGGGDAELCRCGARGAAARTVYAAGGSGGRGSDGGDPGARCGADRMICEQVDGPVDAAAGRS